MLHLFLGQKDCLQDKNAGHDWLHHWSLSRKYATQSCDWDYAPITHKLVIDSFRDFCTETDGKGATFHSCHPKHKIINSRKQICLSWYIIVFKQVKQVKVEQVRRGFVYC